MAGMKAISPADLLIDTENPRLPQPNVGQREAMRELAKELQHKLLALAQDILQHGLSPGEMPFVLPLADNPQNYVVLEGNRRLVALKALENPDLFNGAVDSVVLAELRKLSKQYQESPVERVQCMVVKNREDARHWIELKHTGENAGAGVVRWGSDEVARFKARGGVIELHSQVLNYLQDRGCLTTEQRRQVKATSLKRLVDTPEVRAKIGIDLRNGEMVPLGNEKAVTKALQYVVEHLPAVKEIYTKDDRIAWAHNLPAEVVVKPGAGQHGDKGKAKKKAQPKKPAKSSTKPRETLIPDDCTLAVTDPRSRDIEGELRSLRLDDHPNAIAVLFRVFIELSVDVYGKAKKLPAGVQVKLRIKMQQVVDDLLKRQKLTQQQASPVRKALQKNSFLAPSLDLMNDYVHNENVFPAPGDLRAHWSSLQPFMVAIWSP
jgi:hypothetical protein